MSQFLGNMTTPNFLFDVARGLFEGASPVNIFGFNRDVTTDYETVWNDGGNYTYPSSAVAMTVTTSSASDYGKTVLTQGLDASYDPISEIVTLAAIGAVTTGLFLRVNTVVILDGENIGNITVANSAVTHGYIEALTGIMQACNYSVARNHSLYIFRIDANSATANPNKFLTIRNVTCTSEGKKLRVAEATFSTSQVSYDRQVPFKLEEKTDFQFEAKSSSGTNEIAIFVEAVLVKTP